MKGMAQKGATAEQWRRIYRRRIAIGNNTAILTTNGQEGRHGTRPRRSVTGPLQGQETEIRRVEKVSSGPHLLGTIWQNGGGGDGLISGARCEADGKENVAVAAAAFPDGYTVAVGKRAVGLNPRDPATGIQTATIFLGFVKMLRVPN
jgi:hypothetical protein